MTDGTMTVLLQRTVLLCQGTSLTLTPESSQKAQGRVSLGSPGQRVSHQLPLTITPGVSGTHTWLFLSSVEMMDKEVLRNLIG